LRDIDPAIRLNKVDEKTLDIEGVLPNKGVEEGGE